MVALEPWPTELEVISTIGILYDTTDSSNETEGVAPIIVVTPLKVVAHSNETTDPMFSNTTAKEEQKNPVVEIGMEGRISISAQSEQTMAPIAITLSFDQCWVGITISWYPSSMIFHKVIYKKV